MVRAKTYKEFWENMNLLVPSIDRVKVVSDEVQVQKFIKDVENGEVILVAVLPSVDTEAFNLDNIKISESCYVFILKKSSERDQDDNDWINDVDSTQEICEDVITQMLRMAEDFDSQDSNTLMMRRLNPDKIHIDTEYQYMDCNGRSFVFTMKTEGIKNSNINS